MSEQKQKHTPGPWKLSTENVPPNNWGLPFQIHDDFGLVLHGVAASRTDGPDDLLPIDVAYENLRLLNAAPDLLEALTALLHAPYKLDALCGGSEYMDAAAKARAAIAKAESPNV